MHRDRLAALEALVEVVSLHHPGHRVLGGELDHATGTQGVAPLGVVADFGDIDVQHQAQLVEVGRRIGLDLLAGQRRPGAVAPGRVADGGGEVADQRDHRVAQILQLAHLVEYHCVPEVDIRGSRVQAEFDAQGGSGGFGTLQLAHPLVLRQQFFGASEGNFERASYTI